MGELLTGLISCVRRFDLNENQDHAFFPNEYRLVSRNRSDCGVRGGVRDSGAILLFASTRG